jgi:hypothetical protein
MNSIFKSALNDKSKRVIKSEVKKNKIINPYIAHIETIKREKAQIATLYNTNNTISNSISIEYTLQENNDSPVIDANKNSVAFHLDSEIKKNILDDIFKTINDEKNMTLPDDFDINDYNSKLNVNFNLESEIKKDILDDIFKASIATGFGVSEEQIDVFDINDVYKRNIKTIYNVYQEKYMYDSNSTGFGDFIRGCYYLLDFCEKYGFHLEILINHPMTKFLKTSFQFSSVEKHIFSTILFFKTNNWDGFFIDNDENLHTIPGKMINGNFVSYLRDMVDVFTGGVVYTYSIIYPSHIISEKHKQRMRDLLEPSDEIQEYVDSTLAQFGFIKYNYFVIHIRTGDTYLNEDKSEIYNKYISKLVYEIAKIIIKNEAICKSYVLISDNLNVKYLITMKYPFLKTLFKEVTHLGEGVIQEDEKIKNTLLDFYLLSQSNSIFSFSCYEHGSGFSQWCAETYNIPYYCKATF